jgi:hypothetical protein
MRQPTTAKNAGKDTFYHNSAAVGAAVGADLAAIIQAWHSLPAAVKAGIVAMVKAAKGS